MAVCESLSPSQGGQLFLRVRLIWSQSSMRSLLGEDDAEFTPSNLRFLEACGNPGCVNGATAGASLGWDSLSSGSPGGGVVDGSCLWRFIGRRLSKPYPSKDREQDRLRGRLPLEDSMGGDMM